ncbi:MAG: phosphomannomutase/phosphoglucomutase [Clostridiales bacterium]|nr:phosphomannomutase/phosphoglucomutase [Clostridiales bacterium]
MLNKEWKQLKNGSDIRGIAIKSENGDINLTDEVVYKIACGFAYWLQSVVNKEPKDIKVAVGNDSRISAQRIKTQVINGLKNAGFTVYDCGLISTPAMFMTNIVPGLNCDGSIQITASHLPYDRNGLKFFTKMGGCESKDIEAILLNAQEDKTLPEIQGKIIEYDFLSEYADILVQKVRLAVNSQEDYEKPLKNFKVVVDAGNGAGGFYVEKVLKPLGTDTTGSQFLEPDGTFPNHIPNPENEVAMSFITKAVLDNNADFGIIFDTDVDRAGAVDSKGNEINRNKLIALISAILLEEKTPAIIVTDSITSDGLKKFIENHGGMHHRFKRGYKNVINEAIRLNKEGAYCPIAIETSGHAALKENYFLDDGAYLVTKLLIKMAQLKAQNKKLENLLLGLEEPLEQKEIRMNILLDDFKPYGESIIKAIENYANANENWICAPDNHEGIRISFNKENGDGWFLLRMSLHEPLMPLNIESNIQGGVKTILKQLYPVLKKYEQLDTTGIENFIK